MTVGKAKDKIIGTGDKDIQNTARKQRVQIKSKAHGRIRDKQREINVFSRFEYHMF
jgi:hypothetical protein